MIKALKPHPSLEVLCPFSDLQVSCQGRVKDKGFDRMLPILLILLSEKSAKIGKCLTFDKAIIMMIF